LFGGSFAAFQTIILPIGLAQIVGAPSFGLSLFLIAAFRGRALLVLGTFNAASYLVTASLLAAVFEVQGAAWAGVIAGTLSLLGFALALYRPELRQGRIVPAAERI
jgi:hypothetical protein